jgi:hypothetical protein
MSTNAKIILAIVAFAIVTTGAFFLGGSVMNASTPTNTPTPTTTAKPTITATTTPTNTPTPTAPASQPAAHAQLHCPTTGEVKTLTGVDVQRIGNEPCAFVWRGSGSPGVTTNAICPSGYVCTFDVGNDIVVVHLGVNQKARIRAGTWRMIAAYPSTDAVHNVCNLYYKEKAFGLSEVPSFEVRFQAVYDGSGTLVGPATCP